MKSDAWFLYVLRCSDNTLYTGVTTDIDRRLSEHNGSSKGAKYTRTRRPTKLVYQVKHKNRSEAQKAEYKFKKMARKQKEEIMNEG